MTRRTVGRDTLRTGLLAVLLGLCLACALAALYPQADGLTVLTDQDTTVDASHTDQGYIMVRHTASRKALKLRIVKGDSTYTYDLAGDDRYETFPLTQGSGTYQLQVFKQVSGKRYANDAALSLDAEIADETLPYLYPSQYVWYTADSAAVVKGAALCEGLASAADKVEAIRRFVASAIVYDNHRARTVKAGYIPDIDDVLAKGQGICFDYATLTACMLRTQGIPTRLVIGYADTIYHAWNDVLLDGQWIRVDTTADANDMKVQKYTAERIY